ncbi:hypothetical protein BJ508DRAFT_321616 [Ascobolus immersus RN42]|uniref:Uncharacterized protein n=1 Tax=Ascobolus immersus RN42 TaxID=1160509 RepID=A0A3N4IK17_ASCIM|nr:hypothetical protein BJ508DRAFT_321616 [Ascobolus immersus RN42]
MHNVRCEMRKVDTMGTGEQEDGQPNKPEDDARTKKLKTMLRSEWSRPEDWAIFIDAAIAVHGEEFSEFLRDRLLVDDPLDQTHMGDETMHEGTSGGGWTAVNSSHDGLKAPVDLKQRNGDVVVNSQGVPHILEPDAPHKPGQPHPSPAPSFKRRKLDSAEEEANSKPNIIEAAKTIYKLTMERSSQIRERAGKTTIDEKRSDTMFFWEKENANRRLQEEWTKIGVGQYGLEKDDDGRAYGNVVQSGDWGTRAHKMSIEGEKVRVLRRPGQEGRQIDIITSMEIEDEEAVKFDGA